MSGRKSVFISVANREFGPLRDDLRTTLSGSFDVVVQPEFPGSASDTVRKLDDEIAPCDLLVHLVGKEAGSIANADAVADFFSATPRETFLENWPRAKVLLGDCSKITYANWEPWLALHRGIKVIVYAIEGHEAADFAQREHLDNLYRARCHAHELGAEHLRHGQIIRDVFNHFKLEPPAIEQKIAPPRFLHHAAEHFLGREEELAFLDDAWATPDRANLVSIIAWGGVGKTALLSHWIQTRFIDRDWKTADGEPDPWRYFDWSFYDQGTVSDDEADTAAAKVRTGSVGDFFEQALTFFDDPEPSKPGQGARLADLIRKHRTLFILDGLEPLQQPFNSDHAGQLLDTDLNDLLRGLAARNPGLCLVTSRQSLRDLHSLRGGAAPERLLEDLPIEIAIRLLQKSLAGGEDRDLPNAEADLRDACEAFGRHALSLALLGRFLFDAHGGDIRKRDCIQLEKANAQSRPQRRRNAWKILEVYETWLASGDGRPEDLAVLRLTGLFDRPARPDCLAALRREPVIPGLTDAIVPLDDGAWSTVLNRLAGANLITLRRPAESDPEPENSAFPIPNSAFPLDAHPLIREYFAQQLLTGEPEAYRAAHARLFEHLRETTEHQPDTLEGLQPLYQAVTHGCLAGRQQEACVKVYRDRIKRGAEAFSTRKLGALGANLGAVAAFFEEPWLRLSPNLSEIWQAWLLSEAAFSLRALGRLTEAVEPMRVSIDMADAQEDWTNAAIRASNLSELEVTLGRLGEAVADGRRAIEFAEQSGDADQKEVNRATVADALHQSGEREEARALLEEAERMQAERQPGYPLLYSTGGFRYCDLLLAPAERAAWRQLMECGVELQAKAPLSEGLTAPNVSTAPSEDAGSHRPLESGAFARGSTPHSIESALAACAEATRRASKPSNGSSRKTCSSPSPSTT